VGRRVKLALGAASRLRRVRRLAGQHRFLGRGSSSVADPLVEALVEGGACGFKVHEDTGAHATALDTALRVAEEYDVQVALHTDGLNEALSVADTLAVLDGRTVPRLPRRGLRRRPRPRRLTLAGVLTSSARRPTDAAVRARRGRRAPRHDHGVARLTRDLPGDRAMAADRIRAATMAPRTSSTTSESSRSRRRTRRHGPGRRDGAPHLRDGRQEPCRPRSEDDRHDNDRVLRYLAKLTVNPAIAHGLAHEVGSVAPGKLADLVLWSPRTSGPSHSWSSRRASGRTA